MRVTGLEPALLSEAAPKTAVYANFTTPAYYSIFDFRIYWNSLEKYHFVTLPKSNASALLAPASVSTHTRILAILFRQHCNYTTLSKCCQEKRDRKGLF